MVQKLIASQFVRLFNNRPRNQGIKTVRFAAASLCFWVASIIAAQGVAAQEPGAAAAEYPPIETVTVTGRRISQTDIAIGLDRTSNTVAITREELLSAPSGISGLKMLASLPGFNVQTDGALGLYEFGNSVQVRAFNLGQIGFVLNGIPMGRSDPFGGSPIFRYVDNENLGSVVASPGAGDVSGPSYSTLGPIAFYNAVEPAENAGVLASLTVGDFAMERSFIRLNSGQIGGFSAYLSRSKTDSELWRGPGTIDREHYEAQARYSIGERAYLKASLVANDFFDYDSPSAPASVFADRYEFAYLPAIPESCIQADPGVFDFNGDGTIDSGDFTPLFTDGSCTRYFEDRINVRDDKLYSAGIVFELSDALAVDATWYYEDKDGFGVSPDSYRNSLARYTGQAAAGLDVVHPRGVQYGLSTVGGDRRGAVVNFSSAPGNHSIEFGAWLENETYHRTQQRLNKTGGSADGQIIADEIAYLRRRYTTTRKTLQLYISDTMRFLDDRLALKIGAKALDIDYALKGFRDFNDYAINGRPGNGPADISADYSASFLPMIGLTYDLSDGMQVFASYAESYALPQGADDIFDNALGFEAQQPQAEEAQNFEVGIRANRATYSGSAALFYTAFDNRLFEGNVFNPATEQPEAAFVNGGASTAYGIEISAVVQPEVFDNRFYINADLSWKIARLDDGFASNPPGSQLADSPELLGNIGLTWEPSSWFVANIGVQYTDRRYTDFAQQIELEAYTLATAYVDIGGPNDLGIPENLRFRVNIDNLLDEKTLPFGFTGSTFLRPLNPRTILGTVTIEF